jgi:pilus assembly protein Flp/PilA
MIRDENGASLVEYGLLAAMIAMVALAAVETFGQNVSTLFSTISTSV